MTEDERPCVIVHGRDKQGNERHVSARIGNLCMGHAQRLQDWLTEIETDAVLEAIPSSSGESIHAKGFESSPPARVDVLALTDDGRAGVPRPRGDELWYEDPDIPSIESTIHSWAEQLRCDLDPQREYRRYVAAHDTHGEPIRAYTLTANIHYLLNAHEYLSQADWVADCFDEIKRLWIALQRAHGRPRPVPLGHCLSVDCAGMVWPRRAAMPWCSKCKREYDAGDLARVAITEEQIRKARTQKTETDVA